VRKWEDLWKNGKEMSLFIRIFLFTVVHLAESASPSSGVATTVPTATVIFRSDSYSVRMFRSNWGT
jgi:hypothetical protein